MSQLLGVAASLTGGEVVGFQAIRQSAGRWRLGRVIAPSLAPDPYYVSTTDGAVILVHDQIKARGLSFDRAVRITVGPGMLAHIAELWCGIELVTDDDEALELLMACAVARRPLPAVDERLKQRCRALAGALIAGSYFGRLDAQSSARRKALDPGGLQDGHAGRKGLDGQGGLGRIFDIVRRGLEVLLGVGDQRGQAGAVNASGQVGQQGQGAGLGGGQLVAEKMIVHRFGALSGVELGREPRVGGGGQTASADEGGAP